MADSTTRCTRSLDTLDRSESLMAEARVILELRRPIRGGADSDVAESDIRTRLRVLIGGGALPRIELNQVWAGRCGAAHACTACGQAIGVGETEFEVTTPAEVVLFLHCRCFYIWMRETASASGEAPPKH